MPHNATAPLRFAGLDGLRAVAVFAVVQQHFGANMFSTLFGTATFAVRLFFVLSGFLITGVLLDAAGSDRGAVLRAFYARRAVRIFPAYYLVLLVACVLLPEVRTLWGWHAFYATNIYVGIQNRWIGQSGHLWSLSVEEQFYLVWPCVVLLVPRRRLPSTMIAIVVLAPVARYAIYATTGSGLGAVLSLFGTMDTLVLGAWLAWRWRAGASAVHPAFGMVGVTTYLALQMYGEVTGDTRLAVVFSTTSMALLGVWIVDHVARGGAGTRWLRAAPLAFVGSISYSVYLIHHFIPAIVSLASSSASAWLNTRGSAQWVCVAALSVTWAAVSWYLFERPLNNLKRHFPYTRDHRATPTHVAPSLECVRVSHIDVTSTAFSLHG